jgi:hypothetical protein
MFAFPSGKIQRWSIKIIHDHNLPNLKIWPFKSHVSAAAGALFGSNAQRGTACCLSDKKDLKLMVQHYSFCPLSVTIYQPK